MKIGNMEVYGIIYKIQNNINGKVYIGQTTYGFNKRYSLGQWWVKTHNNYLKNSAKYYGHNNFTVNEFLDVAFSKEELNLKEKMWIGYYKSANKKYGYNMNSGGDSPTMNEESKKKISISRLGFDPEDFTEDIINYYKNGDTIIGIGKKIGVGESVIRKILVKNNIPIKTSGEFIFGFKLEDYKEEIIKLYVEDNMAPVDIGERFGASASGIRGFLKRNGIKIRPMKESKIGRCTGKQNSSSKPIELYLVTGEFIKEFVSKRECIDYLISIGATNSFSGARSGIYDYFKFGTPYKGKYIFKNKK